MTLVESADAQFFAGLNDETATLVGLMQRLIAEYNNARQYSCGCRRSLAHMGDLITVNRTHLCCCQCFHCDGFASQRQKLDGISLPVCMDPNHRSNIARC